MNLFVDKVFSYYFLWYLQAFYPVKSENNLSIQMGDTIVRHIFLYFNKIVPLWNKPPLCRQLCFKDTPLIWQQLNPHEI